MHMREQYPCKPGGLRIQLLVVDMTPVPCLLGASRPSAVLWRIWAVVVNAINGMVGRRARSHIGKEGREATAPTVADRNPTTSPASILPVSGVITTMTHAAPRSIFGGDSRFAIAAVGPTAMAVRSIQASRVLSMETSTTLRVAAPQVTSIDNPIRPTITAARPIAFPLTYFHEPQDNQTTESGTSKIQTSHP